MESNEAAVVPCRRYGSHHGILGGANTRFLVLADAGCLKTSSLGKYNRRMGFDTTDCAFKILGEISSYDLEFEITDVIGHSILIYDSVIQIKAQS
jgi:hypothetical protein